MNCDNWLRAKKKKKKKSRTELMKIFGLTNFCRTIVSTLLSNNAIRSRINRSILPNPERHRFDKQLSHTAYASITPRWSIIIRMFFPPFYAKRHKHFVAATMIHRIDKGDRRGPYWVSGADLIVSVQHVPNRSIFVPKINATFIPAALLAITRFLRGVNVYKSPATRLP
jgi:hypothetical protein